MLLTSGCAMESGCGRGPVPCTSGRPSYLRLVEVRSPLSDTLAPYMMRAPIRGRNENVVDSSKAIALCTKLEHQARAPGLMLRPETATLATHYAFVRLECSPEWVGF